MQAGVVCGGLDAMLLGRTQRAAVGLNGSVGMQQADFWQSRLCERKKNNLSKASGISRPPSV